MLYLAPQTVVNRRIVKMEALARPARGKFNEPRTQCSYRLSFTQPAQGSCVNVAKIDTRLHTIDLAGHIQNRLN